MLQPINPEGANIPGISQAMRVDRGHLLLLSGHVPLDADGAVVGGGFSGQLDQVFRNLQATLKTAGADFSNLARVTFYLRDYDPSLLAPLREIRDRWINVERPPASALIGVAALFHPEVLVEVDALAVLDDSDDLRNRAPR